MGVLGDTYRSGRYEGGESGSDKVPTCDSTPGTRIEKRLEENPWRESLIRVEVVVKGLGKDK